MANFCSDTKFGFDHINELGTSVDRFPGPKVFAGAREDLLLTCKLAIFENLGPFSIGIPLIMDKNIGKIMKIRILRSRKM